MNKRSLLEEFEITPKYNKTLDIKDYDIFPDKNLLDKLRNKIIQPAYLPYIPLIAMHSAYRNVSRITTIGLFGA